MAFKLTKSNISQIRPWLFLREPERRVMDGEVVGGGVTKSCGGRGSKMQGEGKLFD